MSGIISLVNEFSISCVLEAGSRVSLTHLMEFSSFFDLYVLEEKIYFTSLQKELAFHHLDDDKKSPIFTLPASILEHDVEWISTHTDHLYDAASEKFTFSIDSYDYWLTLTESEKNKIPEHHGDGDPLDRMSLLIESRYLDNAIRQAIENLGETEYTLMPSPRNMIPFLSAFHQINTPAMLLYNKISDYHKLKVEDVLSLVRPRTLYLPPLLTVLTS